MGSLFIKSINYWKQLVLWKKIVIIILLLALAILFDTGILIYIIMIFIIAGIYKKRDDIAKKRLNKNGKKENRK